MNTQHDPNPYATAIHDVEATWQQLRNGCSQLTSGAEVASMMPPSYEIEGFLRKALKAACLHLARAALASRTRLRVSLSISPDDLVGTLVDRVDFESVNIQDLASTILANLPTEDAESVLRKDVGKRLRDVFWPSLKAEMVIKQGRPVLWIYAGLNEITKKYSQRNEYSCLSRHTVDRALRALFDTARLARMMPAEEEAEVARFMAGTKQMLDSLTPRCRLAHPLVEVAPTHQRCDFLVNPALAEQVSLLMAEAEEA